MGDPLGADDAQFDVKTLDECAATHVVAAFDPRIEGMSRDDRIPE